MHDNETIHNTWIQEVSFKFHKLSLIILLGMNSESYIAPSLFSCHLFRGANTKLVNRNSYRAVPLSLVLIIMESAGQQDTTFNFFHMLV